MLQSMQTTYRNRTRPDVLLPSLLQEKRQAVKPVVFKLLWMWPELQLSYAPYVGIVRLEKRPGKGITRPAGRLNQSDHLPPCINSVWLKHVPQA